MFTDIEGSSERWDTEPEVMSVLMCHHDALITEAVAAHGGIVGARTRDRAIALFERVLAAVRCAIELHLRISDGPKLRLASQARNSGTALLRATRK